LSFYISELEGTGAQEDGGREEKEKEGQDSCLAEKVLVAQGDCC